MRIKTIIASLFMLLWGVLPAVAESPAGEEVPCPAEMECVLVDTFTKADDTPENKKFQIATLTAAGGYFRVVIMQKGNRGPAAVVSNVRLLHRGRWIGYEKEDALPEGRTAYAIAVPRYSDELTILLDKGKGAQLQVILEREAAGR
jgi:hypothetical protein